MTCQTLDLLDQYLARERLMPFEWSSRANGDCLLLLLGWWETATRRAPARQWRGRYRDEAGARAALEADGGAVAAITTIVGPPRMGSATQRGDIGLVRVGDDLIGAICTGRNWAFREHPRGIRLIRCPADVVWPVSIAPR